ARSRYLVGKDDISYTQGTPPPRCPYVTGQVGTTLARTAATTAGTDAWPHTDEVTPIGRHGQPEQIGPPPGDNARSYLRALTGLGTANSPGENELIAELVAPTQGMAPSDYPDWNSLLLGPTLRNTKVVLK